jgi:hypothetical protein
VESVTAAGKLTVAGMSMGDEGSAAIAQIATLPLTSLRIGQRLPHASAPPSLTDASLATFAGIKTLETVKLLEARLTLGGLHALKSLPKLRLLHLSECDIPEADLEALRKELSPAKIEYEPLTDEQRKKLESYLK